MLQRTCLHAEQAVPVQPKLDKQLRELVEPDCTQRDLDLSLRGLGPDDFKSVAVALAHNTSVFRVDLRRNRPEHKGVTVRPGIVPSAAWTPQCLYVRCIGEGTWQMDCGRAGAGESGRDGGCSQLQCQSITHDGPCSRPVRAVARLAAA